MLFFQKKSFRLHEGKPSVYTRRRVLVKEAFQTFFKFYELLIKVFQLLRKNN